MKKLSLIVLLLNLIFISVSAQDIQIKGVVVGGSNSEPLPGVNIVLKNNPTVGTVTDLDGNFTLSAPENAVLSISYIGYMHQDVAVRGQSFLKITLQEDAETLDEVVVVGYGVQKKSVVTASIAKVSADDLSRIGSTRVDNALKGLASGVTVTSINWDYFFHNITSAKLN